MYSYSSKQLEIDNTIFQPSYASCQSSTVYEYICFNHKCMRSLILTNHWTHTVTQSLQYMIPF